MAERDAERPGAGPDDTAVEDVVTRARRAQQGFAADADQRRLDRAAKAAAWAVMEPARNRELAELAVATTGLGKVEDKVRKNHRKTLGLLRDLQGLPTCGVIREIPERGLTEIARPIGVVGAVVPSTNPVATPVNNVVNALKCGNAMVLAPSPKGTEVCARLLGYIRAELEKAGLPHDLVQMLPPPASKAKSQRLMEAADLVIVTGSQANVRAAYRSGTPAIGVGAGNATVIVDETADLAAAAAGIAASKTFDNATSCSSENAVIVHDAVRAPFLEALAAEGGALLDAAERRRLVAALWPEGGRLSHKLLAKDIDAVIREAGLSRLDPAATRFVVAEERTVGPENPMSGEKLSLALALYGAADFAAAKALAGKILAHQGSGHSLGLYSAKAERALELGLELPTCRVIVNQAHCFATGGAFDNGLPFSLSMGCGSWGGNSIDENLNWRHFLNITRVVRRIPAEEPALEDIFGDYWREVGR
ncbi:MAG: aldehyde dehydrogenase family protein [Kiloniellales bacterium]|nr:aldehyde dehydrogenase family protein [Kiloniellales bacterium]